MFRFRDFKRKHRVVVARNSVGFMLKPFLIYFSENLRVLKRILKIICLFTIGEIRMNEFIGRFSFEETRTWSPLLLSCEGLRFGFS